MARELTDQERDSVIEYFRTNLFETLQAYTAWKMLWDAKKIGIVPEQMTHKYVSILNIHHNAFAIFEHASAFMWVTMLLHAFDSDHRAMSLLKIDADAMAALKEEYSSELEKLKTQRDQFFSHRDIDATLPQLPSIERTDELMRDLQGLYNKITKAHDSSSTIFNQDDMKHDIENMYWNIERGENIRQKEIEVKWKYRESGSLISDII
ncbi:MAG TPA: hypothetical protein VFL98_02660 [Candidatus Paceibacterota bacterium]|nr:hypothetical protein [Candidatus Paceibacterota bacterium]